MTAQVQYEAARNERRKDRNSYSFVEAEPEKRRNFRRRDKVTLRLP